MDKESIKKWLKENMTIEVDSDYQNLSIEVTILIDGEKVASGRWSKYSGSTGPL